MVRSNLKIKCIYCLIVILAFLSLASFSKAVVLSVESGEESYHKNDVFIVDLKIDTKGECVNTIEGHLSFSKENLEIIDTSLGGSIISIWLEKPEINQENGIISFVGGIPGGYCGELPGDPGELGLLNRIIFKVKETNNERANIKFLKNTKILLNDSLGTEVDFSILSKNIKIISEESIIPKTEWQEEISKDNIPPEIFKIDVRKDPSIFEGKYFILFFTTDKQTGIDHYEVKEGSGEWNVKESPYLLENQTIQSIIKVKAVDKAGNETISEYNQTSLFKKYLWLIIVLAAVIIFIVYKRLRGSTNH